MGMDRQAGHGWLGTHFLHCHFSLDLIPIPDLLLLGSCSARHCVSCIAPAIKKDLLLVLL